MCRTGRSTALLAAAVSLWAATVATAATEVRPPMEWPSRAMAANAHSRWLIGIRSPGHLPHELAGALIRPVRPGTISVPAASARRLGVALRHRGLLLYAEPDARMRRASVADTDPSGWARGAVVPANLPNPTAPAPIAVVDDLVDASRPDLAGHVTYLPGSRTSTIDGPHGTEVASAAAASANGSGVMGVAPGAPIASFGLSDELTCGEVAAGVDAAADAKVPIVNLSLGSTEPCFTLYLSVETAFGAGTLVVAAAGNDFDAGNPIVYPAAYPHVLSVAALDLSYRAAYFSTENAAIDVAAPGVQVPLAIPPAFDTADGAADGYTTADGTSFAAPMAAGAASWVLGARPDLSAGQLADVLRFSALDVGEAGYDQGTGYGLVDVPAALALATPREDRSEPNDGIDLVNGSVFSDPDPYIWYGQRSGSFGAAVDWVEDPVDVYRFKMPARSRVRVMVQPTSGDADLEIYDSGARYVGQRSHRVCRSARSGRAADSCHLHEHPRRRPRLCGRQHGGSQ